MPGNPNPRMENIEKYKWKKGFCPNPKGKPKGSEDTVTILTRILNRIVKTKDPFTGESTQITAKEALLLKQFSQAIQGDQKSFDRIFDRLEGKPKQIIDQTNTNVNIDTVLKELENEKE